MNLYRSLTFVAIFLELVVTLVFAANFDHHWRRQFPVGEPLVPGAPARKVPAAAEAPRLRVPVGEGTPLLVPIQIPLPITVAQIRGGALDTPNVPPGPDAAVGVKQEDPKPQQPEPLPDPIPVASVPAPVSQFAVAPIVPATATKRPIIPGAAGFDEEKEEAALAQGIQIPIKPINPATINNQGIIQPGGSVENVTEVPRLHFNEAYPVGSFDGHAHDVAGEVLIVDEKTIQIAGFDYDGRGPAAYFVLGYLDPLKPGNENETATPDKLPEYWDVDETMIVIPDESGVCEPLALYRDKDITIKIPGPRWVSNFTYLSIFAVQEGQNYGSVHWANDVTFKKGRSVFGILECSIHRAQVYNTAKSPAAPPTISQAANQFIDLANIAVDSFGNVIDSIL